ncbi:hypothetical protein ABZX85_26555 [Streptomyces sp. NPDC004539]
MRHGKPLGNSEHPPSLPLHITPDDLPHKLLHRAAGGIGKVFQARVEV